MALKMNDIKSLSLKEAEAKIVELEKAVLESSGEGKTDRVKSMRKGLARLKTYIAQQNAAESKKPAAEKTPVKKVEDSKKK